MSDVRLRWIAAIGLLVGGLLAVAGSAASFATGAALWAVSLVLGGVSTMTSRLLAGIQFAGALLFAIVAVRIFMGADLTPLSTPLPFFAYPFLVVTLFGWSSIYIRDARINDGSVPWFTSGWRVAGLREPAPFFQNVQLLLPPGALLVLDGAFMANDVREFVQGRTVEPQARLASGTLWPRSQMQWLPPTSETLSGLVALSSNHARPEICEHLYAIHDGRLILIWTDAFSDPLMISAELSADSVAAFGRAVKLQPEQWEGP